MTNQENELRLLIDRQMCDPCLWVLPSEIKDEFHGYFQQELRKLHHAIEKILDGREKAYG